jgi:hypothetical protein
MSMRFQIGLAFPSYLNKFLLFFCEREIPKIPGQSQSKQVNNDLFKMECRWFQLFYFLSRIIPG